MMNDGKRCITTAQIQERVQCGIQHIVSHLYRSLSWETDASPKSAPENSCDR